MRGLNSPHRGDWSKSAHGDVGSERAHRRSPMWNSIITGSLYDSATGDGAARHRFPQQSAASKLSLNQRLESNLQQKSRLNSGGSCRACTLSRPVREFRVIPRITAVARARLTDQPNARPGQFTATVLPVPAFRRGTSLHRGHGPGSCPCA